MLKVQASTLKARFYLTRSSTHTGKDRTVMLSHSFLSSNTSYCRCCHYHHIGCFLPYHYLLLLYQAWRWTSRDWSPGHRIAKNVRPKRLVLVACQLIRSGFLWISTANSECVSVQSHLCWSTFRDPYSLMSNSLLWSRAPFACHQTWLLWRNISWRKRVLFLENRAASTRAGLDFVLL